METQKKDNQHSEHTPFHYNMERPTAKSAFAYFTRRTGITLMLQAVGVTNLAQFNEELEIIMQRLNEPVNPLLLEACKNALPLIDDAEQDARTDYGDKHPEVADSFKLQAEAMRAAIIAATKQD